MKPKLSNRELALLMDILNPLQPDGRQVFLLNIKSPILKENNIATAQVVTKLASTAYEKLRTEYMKRKK